MQRLFTAATLAIAGLCGAAIACAQDYPVKTVRIVTTGIGGGNDFNARLVAQGLTTAVGQQVIVDNRSGGYATAQAVQKAPPDGYTLLVYSQSFWTAPLLASDAPYDVQKDFAPISLISRAPNVLVVHPSLPVKSVKELIALAKAKPGQLNYSSGLAGTSSHIAAELFAAMAGVKIVGIRYKSGGPETADLVGGHVQMSFASPASILAHINSQKVRALAVASTSPSALLPGLPTVSASGLPGFESGSPYGMWAPAQTSPTIIRRLHQELVRFVAGSAIKEKFLSAGTEAVGSSPEDFAAFLKTDIARLAKLIKDAGIKAE